MCPGNGRGSRAWMSSNSGGTWKPAGGSTSGPPLTLSTTSVSPLRSVSTGGRLASNWPQWQVATEAGRRCVVMARLVRE